MMGPENTLNRTCHSKWWIVILQHLSLRTYLGLTENSISCHVSRNASRSARFRRATISSASPEIHRLVHDALCIFAHKASKVSFGICDAPASRTCEGFSERRDQQRPRSDLFDGGVGKTSGREVLDNRFFRINPDRLPSRHSSPFHGPLCRPPLLPRVQNHAGLDAARSRLHGACSSRAIPRVQCWEARDPP